MPKETPGQRVQQSLAGAIGVTASGDEPEADLPVAATVVIVRDGAAGPEALMIERPDRGSFAGAWVFPGGKVEPGDAEDGTGEATASVDEEAVARRAGVRETIEETGVALDPATLVTISCWTPPPGLPLRIRTWFFLAPAPAGELELSLSADEAVSATWVRPADVLERHGRGELTLYPPTWVTLHDLAEQSEVDDLLAVARLGGVHRFESLARRGPAGPLMLWQEDEEFAPDAGTAAPGARHRLAIGALPWTYERSF